MRCGTLGLAVVDGEVGNVSCKTVEMWKIKTSGCGWRDWFRRIRGELEMCLLFLWLLQS